MSALTMRRAALLPTLVAGGLVTLGSGMFAGWRGMLGAAVGCALVVAFFGVDLAGGKRLAARIPDAPIALAVGGYLIKIVVLGGVLLAFSGTDAIGRTPFAVAAFTCTCTWLVGHVRVFAQSTTVGPATPQDQDLDTPRAAP